MRIGPFEITRRKAAGQDLITQWTPPSSGGWFPLIRESFAGAWQRGITVPVEDALTHPTFFACVTLIASDIAKGCFDLVKENETTGITVPAVSSAFSPVLTDPNHYQNRIQFIESWVISKLCRGNTFALKRRDNRQMVTDLYILDPSRVKPMVAPNGDVYYACQQDVLSGVTEASVVVPAREIIHDRWNCLYHPLVGLSPVYASGHAAMQSLAIVATSTQQFRNGSQLGGIVIAPGKISTENALAIEKYWADNYAGAHNAGKIAVLSDNMKFDQPKAATAVDSQLIDQQKWADEKICSTLKVPAYMVGVGAPPNYNNIEALNQQYYSQCLQILIESIELCLEQGLNVIDAGYEIEFDMDALLRMDSATKMKAATDGVRGGIYTPNEARQKFNLPPIKGGDTVYLQEQDHSLQWLAERDAMGPQPPAPKPPVVEPQPAKSLDTDDIDQTDAVIAAIEQEWAHAA